MEFILDIIQDEPLNRYIIYSLLEVTFLIFSILNLSSDMISIGIIFLLLFSFMIMVKSKYVERIEKEKEKVED